MGFELLKVNVVLKEGKEVVAVNGEVGDKVPLFEK